MATLQKIRNRGTLLIIVIFAALFAFIIGDAAKSRLFGNDTQSVGEINGNGIDILEFQKRVDDMVEVHKLSTGNMQLDNQAWMQVRNEVWRTYEYSLILDPVCEDLGIDVSSEELFDMVQGNHIHSAIRQMFTDPQTGEFSKPAVINYLRAVNNGTASRQQYLYWGYLESQIKRERKLNKYNALIGKGIYVTSVEAENSLKEKNTTVDFDYIKVPYSSISDSTIVVSDSEIKAYYDKHKENFKQDASRTIEYIMLPIEATANDEEIALEWIQDIRDEFATTAENQQFININSDMAFDGSYLKKEDLDENLANFAFSANVGDVFGPERDGNTYKLVKLDDRQVLPDSVEARHILITPQSLGSIEAANNLADSLKTLIEKRKATFAELANQYSEDTGSASKGGSLGWFQRNQMVKPFEDAAFNGKVNELYVVTSRFGVHLIQPTARGKSVEQVRLAELVRNIEPSGQTEDAVYAKASMLATKKKLEDYQEAVKEMGLSSRRATVAEAQQEVNGLEDSRSLVRSAFKASKEGDFLLDSEATSIYKFGDNFVLARLLSIQEEGYAPIAMHEPSIRRILAKEKKAKEISNKINKIKNAGNDLDAIASALGVQKASATDVSFGMFMVPGIGMEPAVLGATTSLKEAVLSNPIEGNEGVFVTYNTKVSSAHDATDKEALSTEQVMLSSSYAYRVNYNSFEVLKDNIDCEDNRASFY